MRFRHLLHCGRSILRGGETNWPYINHISWELLPPIQCQAPLLSPVLVYNKRPIRSIEDYI